MHSRICCLASICLGSLEILMKGTLMFRHFACHPVAALLNEIGPSHPSLPPRLPLSCGKSVTDSQLSIIQED